MDQAKLNKANLIEWEYDNKYEKLFHLPLTARHGLSVGKWKADGYSGIDLRRWSYDRSRNLGEGISLFYTVWLSLFEKINDLNKEKLFIKYNHSNYSIYEHQFYVDDVYKVETGTWIPSEPFGMKDQYFTINMLKNEKLIWVKKIMIRFNTIPDFIVNCQEHNLAPKEIMEGEAGMDKKTGRLLF